MANYNLGLAKYRSGDHRGALEIWRQQDHPVARLATNIVQRRPYPNPTI